MSKLTEITTYKNRILNTLLNDEYIVKAVGNNESNFLDVSAITDAKDLLFTNIFPHPFVPDIADEQRTYITMFFQFKKEKHYYKLGKIRFNVFAHHNLLKTDYPDLRTDYILEQIERLFNESTSLGIGKNDFCEMSDIMVTKSHFGAYIEYKNISFDAGGI